MEEYTSEIINQYPKFSQNNPIHYGNDNNDKLGDIENSIKSSLINNADRKQSVCNKSTFKLLVTFSLVGILFLLGAIIVLILKKY